GRAGRPDPRPVAARRRRPRRRMRPGPRPAGRGLRTADEDTHMNSSPAVMAHVLRSNMVESVHRGSLVLLYQDGSITYAAAAVDSPIYPRSSNKPMQAAAVLRAGARLSGRWLALAAASHAGEPFHVQGVKEILEAAGVGVDALGCPAFLPKDVGQRIAMVR